MLTEMIFLGLWKGLSEQECLEPTFELNQRSYRSGTADADQNLRHGRTGDRKKYGDSVRHGPYRRLY